MTIITRENITVPLRVLEFDSTGQTQRIFRTYTGTLVWDTEDRLLKLVHPVTKDVMLRLSGRNGSLEDHEVRLLDVRPQNHVEGIIPQMEGALSALRTQGVIANRFRESDKSASSTIVEMNLDLGAGAQAACTRTASVTLFKESGKFYTIDSWKVPVNAVVPSDMRMSPDFRRIDGGAVLVNTDAAAEFPKDQNWGFPQLLPSEQS